MSDRQCPATMRHAFRINHGAIPMLSVLGPRGRLCDSLSRRELISVGSLSLLGLGLPGFLRQHHGSAAAAAQSARLPGVGQAETVFSIYLQGAPSIIEL